MDWLFYLIGLFFARIGDFLRHWYVSSYYVISDLTVRFLEWLDRSLALKVSVRYWLHPLFQERRRIYYRILRPHRKDYLCRDYLRHNHRDGRRYLSFMARCSLMARL
jgi:hypothetical protein